MKTFKVEVIWPNKTYEMEIKCHRVEWSDAGNYVFVIENEIGSTSTEPSVYAVKSAVDLAVEELVYQGESKGLWKFKHNEKDIK